MFFRQSAHDRPRPRIPRGVWALGFVSMFMDTSSELIHALLPVYLVTTFGASMATVGLIEGIAEGTAAGTKLFSGALSDWLGKRKVLVVAGYGLAALAKPIFAVAPSVAWILGARFADRVGKGIRGAPRDALIADLSPPESRGASFGLRQSLDTVGAFVGPLLAILLMWITMDNFRLVFGFAIVPAVFAIGILILFVKEPEKPAPERSAASRLAAEQPVAGRRVAPLRMAEIRLLGAPFWRVIAIAAAFSLARFSDAFLILKAQSAGLPIALVPIVLVLMNVVYAAAAYPAGVVADRGGRNALLIVGLAVLVGADVVLALTSGLTGVAIGVVLWGLHMGLTQGLLSSLVADTAPAALRGTAFGILNLAIGVGLLIASIAAGIFWDLRGPTSMFLIGAGVALLPLALILIGRRGSLA
jgi:MFS family permease